MLALHTALVGKRKQSVKDAERQLSYQEVASLQRHGHPREAAFVQVLVNWHEASTNTRCLSSSWTGGCDGMAPIMISGETLTGN